MHKYIISVFLLSSLNSHGASWADIANGKGKAQHKTVVKPTTLTTPVTQDSSIPTQKKVAPQSELPNHWILLQEASKDFVANKPASTIFKKIEPIMRTNAHPYLQSYASHITAHAFFKENNPTKELICLCNELGASYNEGYLCNVNGQQVFLPHNVPAVHRVCELFATGHLATFKNIYQQLEGNQKDFYELIIRTAHIAGNPHGTYLLAQLAEEDEKHADALELYTMLPATYDPHIRSKILMAQLLHAQANNSTLILLFEEIAGDAELQADITTTLCEKKKTDLAQSFWQHLYKTRQGTDKALAAFELNKILRETNPAMADIYLCIAASAGNVDACQLAFNLGSSEYDEKKAIKYFEAAALGNHLNAIVKCGTYYKNLASEALNAAETEMYYQKSKTFLEPAAKQNSPAARLELAIMPSNAFIIKDLKNLADDATFSLRSEAQYYLAQIYLKRARNHAKQPGATKLRDDNLNLAETYLTESLQLGCLAAKTPLALCILKKASYTNHPKSRQDLISKAQTILTEELKHTQDPSATLAGLGKLHFFNNDPITAHDYFIQAYRLDPQNEYTLHIILNTVNKMLSQKKFDDVDSVASAMLEINPECIDAHLWKGIVTSEHNNDIVKSRNYFEQAAKLGSAAGYKNLGTSYFNNAQTKDDYSLALSCFEESLKICPNNISIMHIMGRTYHALGRYADAQEILRQGAEHNNPDCLSTLANYLHAGYAGCSDIVGAKDLYKLAEKAYTECGNHERSIFCAHMHYILQHQNIHTYPTRIEDAPIYINAFQDMVKNLEGLIYAHNQSPVIINEALYAIASQYQYCAQQYKNPAKKKNAFSLSLSYLERISNKEHIESLFLKAEIIRIMATEKLLDLTVDTEKKLFESLCPLYENLIANIEQNRPLSQILLNTYNNYGLYLRDFTQNKNNAASPLVQKYIRQFKAQAGTSAASSSE